MSAEVPTLALALRRHFPGFSLELQLETALAGITGLFGASGGGKSSLLRILAGLDTAASGTLSYNGECWQDSQRRFCLAAHRRPVGYVFQDARLFSHLDVAGNLRFAARRAAAASGPDMDDVVRAFDLAPLMTRDVTTLSGGERQRVALARTLLAKPRLLLLDEPLAGLDAGRKAEIIPYIESLRERFAIPALYVSHAIDEVARLADNVIVLEQGRVLACGETLAVLNGLRPAAASPRFEAASIIEAQVRRPLSDLHLTELEFHGQPLYVPQLADRRPGESLRLHIRAGDIALATREPHSLSFRNVLQGRLHDLQQIAGSAFATATVDVGGSLLRCHLTRQAAIELELVAGMQVYALLKTASFDERAG